VIDTLPEALRHAVPARQREFVAGRRCAAAAIARLGMKADAKVGLHGDNQDPVGPNRGSADAVGIGENGAPVWPAGVVGSIAHTDRLVCAAAASTARARGIGIDIEPVISRKRAARVEQRIATRQEITHLMARTGLDRAAALTLAFSAKEAVYKCLYPLVGRVFDYLDARVDDGDALNRDVTVRLITSLSAECPRGTRIRGRFVLEHDLVWTGFVLVVRPERSALSMASRGSVCPERNRGECLGTAPWWAASAERLGSRRFRGATHAPARRARDSRTDHAIRPRH
jgi:enterobactin synthetase component D